MTIRRVAFALSIGCTAVCGVRVTAEVTPVPAGSASSFVPGTVPPTGLPVPAPKPATTNPAPAQPRAIDVATKTSATPSVPLIDAYIKTNFVRLASDDPAAVTLARADLVSGVSSPGAAPASAPFLNAYMTTLVSELQPLVGKASPSKRLNAAIVIARVCANMKASNAAVSLQPLYAFIIAELNDKSDAVSLWGMKAAIAAIGAAPGAPTQAIINAVVTAVQAHGMNGPITEEAYDALNGATPENIALTMKLYKMRVDGYANGATPPEPLVDRRAAGHLTNSQMWSKMTPAQQAEVMAIIQKNLEGAVAAMTAPTVTLEAVRDLQTLIRDDCKAIDVATTAPGREKLHFDAHDVWKLSDSASVTLYAERAAVVINEIPTTFPPGAAAAQPGAGNEAVAKP